MTNLPPIAAPTGNEGEQVNLWLQFLVGIGKIAIPFAAGYFTHVLTGIRDRKHRFALGCGKFRSAFAPTVAAAEAGRTDLHGFRAQEDAAIVEFRSYLTKRERAGFDAACEQYREHRKRAYPIPDAFGQVTTFPRIKEVRDECARTLKQLFSYADKI